ncbi:MAG: SRPBCC family protein [Chloroflexi bacterium]|nr:SRPBCC family protein [Chloroflexota bacterium]
MRRRVTLRATVGQPARRVFPYLADPVRWPRFVPAVVFRRPLGTGPIRAGATWMATDRIGPFLFHFVDELAVHEPHRRLVWLSSSPWNSRVEYLLADADGVTHIRATYDGDIAGPLRLLVGWLPPPLVRHILAQDFRRLDDHLAREDHALRRWNDDQQPTPRDSRRQERRAAGVSRRTESGR